MCNFIDSLNQMHKNLNDNLKKFLVSEPCFNQTKEKNYIPYITFNSVEEMKHFKSHHWGQRKLLLGELMFFTITASAGSQKSVRQTKVIYAGGAPCDHITILNTLFPNLHFDLIDPAPWNETFVAQYPSLGKENNTSNPEHFKINDKIDVYHGYFTDALAQELAEKYKNEQVLFISDIRDLYVDSKSDTIKQREDIVNTNMQDQSRWFSIIQNLNAKPEDVWCMLKFKPTFGTQTIEYFDGMLFYQGWAPLKSPELRLITNTVKTKIYDTVWLEQHLSWYNDVRRNTLVKKSKDPRINALWDTQYEYDLLTAYKEKNKWSKMSQLDLMFYISKNLGRFGGYNKQLRKYMFQAGYNPEPWRMQKWCERVVTKNNKYGN